MLVQKPGEGPKTMVAEPIVVEMSVVEGRFLRGDRTHPEVLSLESGRSATRVAR